MARPRRPDREAIRTERVSLALTPATYEGILTLAAIKRVSVNELIGLILEQVVKKNFHLIKQFDDEMKKIDAALDIGADVEGE